MSASVVRQPGTTEAGRMTLEERSLARAFASFTEVAGSLERSYGELQLEVARLRHELEQSHLELEHSLEQNRHMRLRLNRIVEALPCGVLVTEPGGMISIANAETQRQVGVGSDTQLPGWLSDLLQQVPSDHSELEYRRSEQETGWSAIRRAQLSADDGGSSIFILQDITAAKRIEQEQGRLRKRQALVELSATLAHEIRNPLGSLELFAGLLAGSGLGAEPKRWVEHLQAGLRTLAATVNNVLQFHSEPPPELAPTDIGQLLNSLHQFLEPLAQQTGVTIELTHDLEGVAIAADGHRLQQVFLNLALNAFRVMPDGGVLEISGDVVPGEAAGCVRIELRDSGPGISPENKEDIFTAGFTSRPGSPGLGLAVCKAIVEQHGGKISVSNNPTQGAVFILEFPFPGGSQ